MLFRPADLEGIASGRITLAFRRWEKPRVLVGSKLRTSIGVLEVTAVDSARYAATFARCYVATDAELIDHDELAAVIDGLNALPPEPGYVTDVFAGQSRYVQPHNAARIVFDNVEVNADGVLGEVDQGGALLEGILNIGRGAVASEMVGVSEEVFGRTVGYL